MPHHHQLAVSPSKQESWKLFDKIAGRYDGLNRILSFGIDIYWRRQLASHLPVARQIDILDLATGTADQLIDNLRSGREIRKAVGMDLAQEMLKLGQTKLEQKNLTANASLQVGDAMKIPAEDQSFDAVSISFGIRNVPKVENALSEMFRVLRPNGRALILEFALPESQILRSLYLLYLRHLLPYIGGWLSGDSYAYRYLNQTIETFPCGEGFCDLLRGAGFSNVRFASYTFGIVSLYIGEKAK